MANADEKIIKLARERFKLAELADEKQRERELADLRFYAGDQWDSDLLRSRQGQAIGSGSNQQVVPARPSLTINKTREPVRQVLNSERQSNLSIELIPADDFGDSAGPIDHTEIELREGLIRRIQRDSEAADARTWAFARAAIAGRGYYLVMTRFVPGKSWDQEVYVERIYNQSTVLLDPQHEQPDGSDAEWGFYGTDMSWQDYKSQYGGGTNRIANCDSDDEWRALGDEAPGWFKTEGETRMVRVMNYYYTEFEDKSLALLEDGSVAWVDELPEGVIPKETRTVVKKSITWCKIDGCYVLEETDWPGHFIPIIKVVGEELQPYDNQRRCEGIVRPMLDSCKGNNYLISKFVERVGLTPIPPIVMAGGQDEGYEAEWDAANTRTLSRLHYNQVDNFDRPAPPPFKPDARAEISDLAMGLQMFGQAIAATSVVPETALGNVDPSVKSGKLAKALIDQAERGTSNFLDNLVRSMRHESRVENDLLYPIYGSRPGRLGRLVNPQNEMSAVLIGRPFTMQGDGKEKKPVPVNMPGWQPGMPLPQGVEYHGLTPDADFNVAVKISKSEDTRRQQIASALGEIIGADPSQMQIMGDKLWKYLDLPDHEEMEERYKVMLAPPIQQLISGDSPLPPEAQAKIAMLEQQLQEVMPLADKNKSDLMKTEMQQKADTERTAADIASREKIERWKIEAQLEIEMAKLGNATMMKRAEIDADLLHAHSERQQAEQDRASEAMQAQQDQQHEREMSDQQHQQALEQGAQQHESGLIQSDQGHQQTLEQGAQQAALQPEPAQP